MERDQKPLELAAGVLDDVASVVGAEVTLLSRLPGGVNAGTLRVQVAGGADAVLKAVPWTHPDELDGTLRAQRIVERMRGAAIHSGLARSGGHRHSRMAPDGFR